MKYEENQQRVYTIIITHGEINEILNTLETNDIPDLQWLEDKLKSASEIQT